MIQNLRFIRNLIYYLLILYSYLQCSLLRADNNVQNDRLFPTMIVSTDQSAIEHIKKAQILIDLGEFDKSITYLNIISQRYQGDSKEVEARLLGGLARNYLKLGLNTKAIQFWEEAIKIIEDSKDDLYLKAVFRNNMSLAYLNLNEPEKAHKNLLQSLEDYPLMQTYQKLSDLVLDRDKDFEKSNFYLTSGLKALNDPTSEFKIYIDKIYSDKLNLAYLTEGYGYHYYVKNDLETSLQKYQEVLALAEDLKRVNLRIEMLKKLGYLYQDMGNPEKSTLYFAKHIKLSDSLRIIMNNSLSIPVYNLASENFQQTEEENFSIFIIIGVAFIGIVAFITLYAIRKKNENIVEEDISEKNPKQNDTNLSQKIEEDLMQKLHEFENSDEFLNKDMSFSSLVTYLNTNEKYLRQFLKCNLDKDYNTYINELRIRYIVEKLKTDPDYLHYKVIYLAKESGFSSHSNFSSNFRQFVGQTPSEFINGLKRSKEFKRKQ